MNVFKKKYIPNWLTIFRIIIVPVIIILFVLDSLLKKDNGSFNEYIETFKIKDIQYGFTPLFLAIGVLFVLASISDILDGYLARKYKWVSEWGKIWDPIADKAVVNSTCICLAVNGLIPFWIVVIFILRDTIVDAYRNTAAKKGYNVAANKWGKFKTIFQMVGVIVILFLFNDSTQTVWQYWTIQNCLIFIACFFSIFSGINYVIDFSKSSKNDGK
ncbi:MAG: CDP-diacylglycerol--glycerol-3-phosphate 3-phosphatidyltransferase [Mycoplasmoidaceae bacterium]|nr:MAG: CDP-diacylglycerol--glycerol-3-phosphate 3-phosphatidyltransferase [Mycoplasmoidaceae bacterium]